MYLAIIIMPLIGSIISGFFGRKIGVKGSHIITCSLVMFTTILAILAYIETGLNNSPVSLYLFRWIDSESLAVFWGFNFDSLTVCMLIPVLIVSSLVHLYSIGYMSHDPHQQRFFSYLSLFTFMMIILVTANNYILMFVGWEGVGICSYLLVSFWFTRIAANQSSISAILTNRVGDCFLTIGMFAILWSLGNLDYATVFSLAPFINENIITFIGICLLIGAMAKSSQIGLHVWLPMAMEGPTPVSALIHAATMVTAGVYLLIRSSPLIEYSSTVLLLCLWLGAITTVFSSLIGLFQQDIKKVIAYSTMSQLGIMVIAVGLSSYNIALFHLVNHAFYKALLFLGAGAVIHAVADNQDFRKYGGLKEFLPLSYSVMFIASLSLVAFPFMTGFYSKDFILESSFGGFYLSSIAVYYIASIGAMFTTLYSIKTLYLTFITNPNGPLVNYKSVHEGNIYMSLPLIVLALFSIFFGFITKDMFIGLGSDLFTDNSIYIHPTNEIMLNTEFAVPTLYKLLPLIFTISLSIISLIISEFLFKSLINFKFSRLGYNIFSFFNLRFLIELIYNRYITETVLSLGGQTTKVLDRGAIELVGPYGLEKALVYLSKKINVLNTGVVTTYALYILVGLLTYISISYMSLFSSSALILLLLFVMGIVINNDKSSSYIITDNEPLESRIQVPRKFVFISNKVCKKPIKRQYIKISRQPNINTANTISFMFYINLILFSAKQYLNNFNYLNTIMNYLITRIFIMRSIAFLILPFEVYKYITTGNLDISLETLWTYSGYVILAMICYSMINLPWQSKKVIGLFISCTFNIAIISLTLVTIMLLFKICIFVLPASLLLSAISMDGLTLFGDSIDPEDADDADPNSSNNPNPGGGNPGGGGDPGGGGNPGGGPNDNDWRTVSAALVTHNEFTGSGDNESSGSEDNESVGDNSEDADDAQDRAIANQVMHNIRTESEIQKNIAEGVYTEEQIYNQLFEQKRFVDPVDDATVGLTSFVNSMTEEGVQDPQTKLEIIQEAYESAQESANKLRQYEDYLNKDDQMFPDGDHKPSLYEKVKKEWDDAEDNSNDTTDNELSSAEEEYVTSDKELAESKAEFKSSGKRGREESPGEGPSNKKRRI